MVFESYEGRQERVKGWLNGGCGFVRCKVDSTGSKEEKKAYYLKHMATCDEAERTIWLRFIRSIRSIR